MTKLTEVEQTTNVEELFTALLHEVAREDAPRLFAIVEEYGQGEDVRVAAYGLAYDDRAELNSVAGDFRLSSQSAESARRLYEISPGAAGVRRAHVVWLDEAATATRQD